MKGSLCSHVAIANALPPLLVVLIITVIESVYVFLHLLPLLQLDLPPEFVDQELQKRGVKQAIISQSLTVMLLICFYRATCTSPGASPDTAEWRMGSSAPSTMPTTREMKVTGERRHCKWCLKYKPDRCHHCRLCKVCVLKMDHHCPWIMNCVGFANHKFFFLLVLYTVLTCLYITATLSVAVQESMYMDMPVSRRFLMVLGLTLAITMGTLTSLFLTFHTWLMAKGLTTIEHCEKRSGQASQSAEVCVGSLRSSPYDLGVWENLKEALGSPWFWLLPIAPHNGDGIHFKVGSFKAVTAHSD